MTVTPSKFRSNLYRLLDSVLLSNEPLEINRNGKKLLVVPEHKKSRISSIIPKKISCASDKELINTDWGDEWKPFI